MEQEVFCRITEWSSTYTKLSIPARNFHKAFKFRVDAEHWAKTRFKHVKFETVTCP